MRTLLSLSLAAVATVSFAQMTSVTEGNVLVDSQPVRLMNLTGLFDETVRGAIAPESGSQAVRFALGNIGQATTLWYPSFIDPHSTDAFNAVSGPQGEAFFWTKSFDGTSSTLNLQGGSANTFSRFSGVYPGNVQNVVLRNQPIWSSAWLVPGPTSRLYVGHGSDNTIAPFGQNLPGAAKLVDYQVMASGVSFVTTSRGNGLVDYRSLFSKGGVRWTLTFPANTILRLDPSGHTYAAIQTANGVEVRRYDFNSNLEGSTLLPAGFGDRMMSGAVDPNHYFFVLTSRLDNGRRIANVVRLNPALTPRMYPLPGYLATGKPGTVNCDPWGQLYAVTTTTAQSILTERVSVFDTLSFLPRWQHSRTLAEGDSAASFLPNEYGGIFWGNRTVGTEQGGYVRRYRETGLRQVGVGSGKNIWNGGGEGNLMVSHYGRVDTAQIYRLKSNHPDLVLPETITVGANTSFKSVPITIPQGSTRRVMKVEAENVETRERRVSTVVINPWVEPTIMSATFYPNSVTGGNQTELRVWLSDEGKGWTVAHLSASGSGIELPESVTLPAGKVAHVMLNTQQVAAKIVRRIDVRVGAVTKSDFLSINP